MKKYVYPHFRAIYLMIFWLGESRGPLMITLKPILGIHKQGHSSQTTLGAHIGLMLVCLFLGGEEITS